MAHTLVKRCLSRLFSALFVEILLVLLLFGGPARDAENVAALVVTRALALCGNTPGGARRPTPGCATLTATVGMVDGVHRDTAHRRPDSLPPLRARLPDIPVHVLRVGERADGGHAVGVQVDI